MDEHTCLTAPAMFMQVMEAILIGGWAREVARGEVAGTGSASLSTFW